jgi:hypothetical protein
MGANPSREEDKECSWRRPGGEEIFIQSSR